jgi:hypothetical protein
MSETVNIITLKWGTLYGPEYVNRLYRGVKRHLNRPFRFICFTDDTTDVIPDVECLDFPDFPVSDFFSWSAWRKFSLLRDDVPFDGLSMFLDLDVLITGPMDKFFDFGKPEDFVIIHNWVEPRKTIFRKAPDIGNSSCFRFVAKQHHYAFERILAEGDDMVKSYPTEQAGLTDTVREFKVFWPDEWVRSFKRHCQRAFPLNRFLVPKFRPEASILAFHGRPNPDQAIAGFRGTKPHHYTRPTPWVETHWINP